MKQPYEPTPPSDAAKTLEVLKSLPSFEDTKAQVQAAMDEITATVSNLIPGITWETGDNADSGNCRRPYEQTGGQDYYLPNRFAANVSVSEQNWSSISQAAKDSAAKVGATDIQVFRDQPGNHDVGFYGPAGTYIKIGYAGSLGVSGYTGCRLQHGKK